MTTTEYLCRHFSRMGARLKIQGPGVRQGENVRIDVGRDRDGEFFDVRCRDGVVPEILEVRPASRHLVLMVRDGGDKNKFLLGRDERHWFAAAVPGDGVHDVRTAIASLRPTEVEGRQAVRQGEWFFVPAPEVHEHARVIYRNEPLSRGGGSKASYLRRADEAFWCHRHGFPGASKRDRRAGTTGSSIPIPRRAVCPGAEWSATLRCMQGETFDIVTTRPFIWMVGIAST
jgi:hypothetical protein